MVTAVKKMGTAAWRHVGYLRRPSRSVLSRVGGLLFVLVLGFCLSNYVEFPAALF